MSELSVIIAFFAAIISAVFGFLKNRTDEDFQPSKILATLLAAVFVAFISIAWGINPETGNEMWTVFFMQTGAIVYIERIFKAIWRNWLVDWLGWLTKDDPEPDPT